MNIFNLTPFYNYYEDMRHKSKIKLYIENDDDDGTYKSMMMMIMMIIVMIIIWFMYQPWFAYTNVVYITCQSLTIEIYVNNGDIKDL
jgi:hypothetical protein